MPVFLFTDIEGSTQLWERHRAAMARALTRHDTLLTEQIARHGGRVIKHTGDGVFAVFEGGKPLECVIRTQTAFAQADWSPLSPMRIRIAMHAGEAERRGDDYFGPAVNRTARLLPIGWGGQILLTPAVAEQTELPEGAMLKDLGAHLLPDLREPQSIYTLLHADLPQQEFPPLRTLSAHIHNLPIQATAFVGREREMADLHHRLSEPGTRLLTLVGPGGMGKTRLALQLAAEQISTYRHGVCFIPLTSVSQPQGIVPAIATALKFVFQGPQLPVAQLLRHLRDKEMLLILDNFEHLLKGVALLSEILEFAPQVRILVTSRERLNVYQESLYMIHGMTLPLPRDEQQQSDSSADGEETTALTDAVELFLQSARQALPDFTPSADEYVAIAQICHLVDGMPLAIEVAAAWVNLLPCHQIAQQIAHSFAFLTRAEDQLPVGHSSLRAVFEYVWGFFADYERRIVCRLAIFRGGFNREAAAEIADASFFFLSSLVERALLHRSADGRYEMHEMLRQFALEQLAFIPGEREFAADRHAAFYAGWLKQREDALRGPEQQVHQAALNKEIDNIRLAWNYLLEAWDHPVRRAKATACLHEIDYGLFLFFELRGLLADGRELFLQAADKLKQIGLERMTPTEQNLWATLTTLKSTLHYMLGSYAEAGEQLRFCLDIFRRNGSHQGQVLVLNRLAVTAYLLGDYPQATSLCREGLALARSERMIWDEANFLKTLGNIAYMQGQYLEARELYEECRQVSERQGYLRFLADSFNNLGNVASALGEFAASEKILEEGLVLYQEIGLQFGVANVLNNLAHVATLLGDYGRARQLYRESLIIHQKNGMPKQTAFALKNIGDVAMAANDLAGAEQLYRQSLAIYQEIDDRREIAYSMNHLGDVAQAKGDFATAAEQYQQALAIFRELDYYPGQSYALDSWGTVARKQGQFELAAQLHRESLTFYQKNHNGEGVGYALLNLGLLVQDQGQHDQAQQFFVESLNAFEEIGAYRGIVTSLTNMGELLVLQGDTKTARQHLCRALQVALKRYAIRPALRVLVSLALLQDRRAEPLADDQRALGTHLQAVEIAALCCHHPASDRETRRRAAQALDQLKQGLDEEQLTAAVERGEVLTFTQLDQRAVLALTGCSQPDEP